MNDKNDKNDSFNNFFDSVDEDKKEGPLPEKTTDSPKLKTPKEMLSDPDVPPPSPHDIKEYEGVVSSFEGLIKTCREIFDSLPKKTEAEYIRLKETLSKYDLSLKEDMAPEDLFQCLGRVQMAKNEIVNFIAESNNNHLVMKRYIEILMTSYNSVSQQKTSDKRKAEAMMKLFDFSRAFIEAESFFTRCKYLFDNLESQNKNVSRMITCMQARQAIGEISSFSQSINIREEPDSDDNDDNEETSWLQK